LNPLVEKKHGQYGCDPATWHGHQDGSLTLFDVSRQAEVAATWGLLESR
jgi:hypothetical protein